MKRILRVLVACEESQTVCKAFRALGHEAYSCDLLPSSGGHPEWHIQGDAIEAINSREWDLVIAHPPCTHIAQAGGRWFERKRISGDQEDGLLFFSKIFDAKCRYLCVENPKGILSSDWYIQKWFPGILNILAKNGLPRRPNQVIHPYHFGEDKQKETHLWLRELPLLSYTSVVQPAKPLGYITRKGKYRTGSTRPITWLDNASKKEKSKTFQGIADAMASQWSEYILSQNPI